MGTATQKVSDGVKRYVSISMTIDGIEDMRTLVKAYDDMKEANPNLANEDWDTVSDQEYLVSIMDY